MKVLNINNATLTTDLRPFNCSPKAKEGGKTPSRRTFPKEWRLGTQQKKCHMTSKSTLWKCTKTTHFQDC